ncbi:MAG: PH domain-containing protein [Chloroflexota bacterium]
MTDKFTQSMLGENERIILMTRQHWFVLFSAILLEIIVTIGIMIGAGVASVANPLLALTFLLVLLPILSGVHDILAWRNRQYIVTNWRVIQFSGIFNKNVVDSSLEKVNDVKMTQSFLGRIFGYGDVEIMTASELGVNVFKRIDEPVKFKTAMLNAREKIGFDALSPHNSSGGNIPAQIMELDDLRKKGILTEQEFLAKKKELLAKM